MTAANSDPPAWAETPFKASFGKRAQAWVMAHCGPRYERLVAERKRGLLAGLEGNILEIGPGTGPNLKYYSRNCHCIGVEPNLYMHPYLNKAAEDAKLYVELRRGLAERLPAADESMDAVVSTLVLCSVSEPAMVLREVLRVLKPGGRLIFIEHVAAPQGTWLRWVQRVVRPLWKGIADGCHPDRETGITIEEAGFARVSYEQFRLALGPVAPQIAGFAIR